MFDDVKQSTAGGNNETQQHAEDIFESTDKPEGNIKNENSSQMNSGNQIGSENKTLNSMTNAQLNSANNMPLEKSNKRRILKVLLILVIIGIIGISGYLGWQYFSKPKTETNKILEKDNQDNVINKNKEKAIVVPDENKSNDIDSDNDGLLDQEEKEYGTDINSPDSDNDGLLDREEVMIYHTNPLETDTDGDGYLDGAEVKANYNPNGSGKLLPDKPTEFNQ